MVQFATASAQTNFRPEQDTLKVQQIEDVNLHKTGNPNKAKLQTTKSSLTAMETPQAIAVVTHEIIEQQQSKQLSEVLQNVNGVYVTSSRGNSQDTFGGRGFIFGNDNLFKNGTRINSGVFPEISGLERVEVLKGANAMLYGNTAAGGLINMVTKKPRFNFGGSAGMSIGSWNSYKPTIDIFGPLNKDVAFRINGTYEYAESFRDEVESQKQYFNPSFLFNLGKKTQVILEGDYLKSHFTPDFGIGSLIRKDGSYSLNNLLPNSAFLGTPWQFQDVQQGTSSVTVNSQLSQNWLLNAVASYQNYTKDYFSTERVQWTETNNRFEFKNRPLNRTYNEQNYVSAQVNLNGEFTTGRVSHKVLVGTDADYNAADAYTFYNPANGKVFGTGYVYGANGGTGTIYLDDTSTWAGGEMPAAQKNDKTKINTRRFGAYAQDFIGITKTLKLIAGLRWSYIENMPTFYSNFKLGTKTELPNTATYDRAFSPKAGIVYMPNGDLSIFATYTNSFAANSGYTSSQLGTLDTAGSAAQVAARIQNLPKEGIKPTTVDQIEAGVKTNLWNNAVAVNLSAYHIMYNNYYQAFWYEARTGTATTIVTPDSTLKEFAGKMRSRGVELDITGNPTPRLSLVGGMSYNNSVYVDTPERGYVENQRLVRTPSVTANASAFYTFADILKGLKLGGGIYYIGGRLAGWNDSKSTNISRGGVSRIFSLNDYTTVVLSAGYSWKNFTLQAKVGNLFNVENYTVHENYSVNPATPRNFYLTLSYKL